MLVARTQKKYREKLPGHVERGDVPSSSARQVYQAGDHLYVGEARERSGGIE